MNPNPNKETIIERTGMNNELKGKLVKEFSDMFPGYKLEKSSDEGFNLLRVDGIETEDGKEDVWVATVYEMAELFALMELNRKIVNERLEVG